MAANEIRRKLVSTHELPSLFTYHCILYVFELHQDMSDEQTRGCGDEWGLNLIHSSE